MMGASPSTDQEINGSFQAADWRHMMQGAIRFKTVHHESWCGPKMQGGCWRIFPGYYSGSIIMVFIMV